MKLILCVASVLLCSKAHVVTKDDDLESTIEFKRGSIGTRNTNTGSFPAPIHYYEATPIGNGRLVYQIDTQSLNRYEQMPGLGSGGHRGHGNNHGNSNGGENRLNNGLTGAGNSVNNRPFNSGSGNNRPATGNGSGNNRPTTANGMGNSRPPTPPISIEEDIESSEEEDDDSESSEETNEIVQRNGNSDNTGTSNNVDNNGEGRWPSTYRSLNSKDLFSM